MSRVNIKIAILLLILCCGFFFGRVWQPEGKTYRIYKNALTDYENNNFSNSYFLFSKIGMISPLKPAALYRQALCAKSLGDSKSELSRYKSIIRYYPYSKLGMESRYQTAQMLVDDNPGLALKYLNAVLKSDMEEDYKIAAGFLKSKIYLAGKNSVKAKLPKKKSQEIEASFRKYLEYAPDGRYALNVVKSWLAFDENISSNDRVLCARAYYNAEMYKEALDILKNAKIDDKWALLAELKFKTGDIDGGKKLVDENISKYPAVDKNDFRLAVNSYLGGLKDEEKNAQVSNLFGITKGENREYLWNIKCETSDKTQMAACYNSLYTQNPQGEFAQSSLENIFNIALLNKDYASAKSYGHDYITRFPNTEQTPRVMFWLGKIEHRYSKYQEAQSYFNQIISKYPDSYYAYRSFWILKGLKGSVVSSVLEVRPVVYPYKSPGKGDILYSLLKVDDCDMIVKFTKDDFIKSWAQYKKGNYSQSMLIARDAMAKLEEKPVKNDLRWRLVYPQNYYLQVKKYADKTQNNDALIISIIREESFFNPEAQSGVGAMGLMQLMPSTAHEIAQKSGIDLNTLYLFNSDLNINLGNLYFSQIKGLLGGDNMLAVAAYNGGIGSVNKWKSMYKYSDIDEFVEQIPYPETKNYVQKVFRSYWNYLRIYQQG